MIAQSIGELCTVQEQLSRSRRVCRPPGVALPMEQHAAQICGMRWRTLQRGVVAMTGFTHLTAKLMQ
jgi:hypothetical protein